MTRVGSLKNDSMNKIISGRKFNRASDSPLAAAKALNVRKSLYFTEQYKENLNVADKFYTEAETSLLEVSDKLHSIRETLIAACNTGIKSSEEYEIYAQQLETYAKHLCQIFNTDSAGRAIFGGSSDNGQPFTIENDANGNASTVLYHNVPVNAYDDYSSYPYSKEILADIGLGLAVDQETHEVDPQSALKISFNGPEVSGCGSDGGIADIDMSSLMQGKEYSIDVYCNNVGKTVIFKGGADAAESAQNLKESLDKEFIKTGTTFDVTEQGVITNSEDYRVCLVNSRDAENKLSYTNNFGYSNRFKISLGELENAKEYIVKVSLGEESQIVKFTAGADETANIGIIQGALDAAFGANNIHVADDGAVTSEGKVVTLKTVPTEEGINNVEFDRDKSFSQNYIQLTLDAAKALRSADVEYANACIDKIVEANENLLVEIANLGCNEDFISFSLDRMTTREYNLSERQEDLEACDLEEETTRLKTYTAMYNACLQLATEVVPQSIFSFMR